MHVELRLTDAGDAQVIKNLWPLYVHDISAHEAREPNRHGVLHPDDSAATLGDQGDAQAGWWQNPGVLFPYLIVADGRPAGFDLVATGPFIPKGVEADVIVYEFFVLHAFRGRGVAERAAHMGFDAHPGRWEVVTYPSHAQAIAFWRRAVGRYTGGTASEQELDHAWGRKLAFRFDSRDRAARRDPLPSDG